ncbi:MAG: insulinase family protein [Myxococcales bacterium]|nr:insulinase family protein [Myxococcales bacterium]
MLLFNRTNAPTAAALALGVLLMPSAALQAQGAAAASAEAKPAAPKPAAPKSAPASAPKAAAPKTPAAKAPAAGKAAEAGSGVKLPVLRRTLANGLRVVMSPDKTVPTTAVAIYYDVGSRDEQPGGSGFAHLFEHMMFQGSRNVGKGEHFQLVMNRGGSANGTTSHDRTNYYQTVPSNDLALALWLEADRMRSLAITQDNFENQRQTVMEERRQSYDNSPYMKSMLRINELAYGDYFPYAHSTIGDMADLQKAPLSAVQEFFDTYYAPNNAVLGIVGDFEPEAAMVLVEKYFGAIPKRSTRAFNAPPPAAQKAERRESMSDPLAELPAFHIAYHIPPEHTDDHYPLDVLAMVLGDGESSRLYQQLVKGQELLQEIDVNTDGRRGPDLFSVWAVCAKDKKAEAARAVIYEELSAIAKRGIRDEELQKAKNRIRSYFVFGLQSNLQRAQRLAEFELYWGDPELLNAEADRYLAVTVDDVKRVAGQYFAAENRTVLDVLPVAKAEPPAPAKAADKADTTKKKGKQSAPAKGKQP